MVDSVLWSVGVGREAASGLVDELVVPQRGGEGEQPQGDAGGQSGVAAPAVALERQLALAGPEDRFDPLADRAECAVEPKAPEVAAVAGAVAVARAAGQLAAAGGFARL